MTEKDLPLISVIVPVYNAEEYLPKCIDSILQQTYYNLEIILVNDGSRDRSGNICDEYAQIDNRVKVVHKQNGGVSKARNAGLNVVNGDFIGFVDSDDAIDAEMYECLYARIIETGADICVCGYRTTDGKSEGTVRVPHEKKLSSAELWDSYLDNYEGYCSIMNALWNKLYRRDLISSESENSKAVRFEEILFTAGDMRFNIDCISAVENGVVFIDRVLYNYSRSNNPESLSYSDGKYDRMIIILEHFKKALLSVLPNKKKEIERFIEYGCSINLLYDICQSIILRRKKQHKMSIKAVKTILSRPSAGSKDKLIAILLFVLPDSMFYMLLKLYRSRSKKPKLLVLR